MKFQEKNRKLINFNHRKERGLGNIPYYIILPSGDWRPYTRDDEKQKLKFDTEGCSEYSPMVSSVEAQLNFFLENKLFSPGALDFFTKNNYIVDGQFQCSVEYNATLAGTTINGNSPENFAISVQRDGIIPESMLNMTLEESQQYLTEEEQDEAFYDNKRITQKMRDMGKASRAFFNVDKRWIGTTNGSIISLSIMRPALLQAPLIIGVPIENVGIWNSGLVTWNNRTELDHCVGLEFIDPTNVAFPFCIHDNYNPFQKRLASNYYISQVLQIILTLIAPPLEVQPTILKSGFNITNPLSINFPNNFGIQVYLLQNRLIQDSVATFFMPTGFFGHQTQVSLLAYQSKYMLPLTGWCDPQTIAFIQKNG